MSQTDCGRENDSSLRFSPLMKKRLKPTRDTTNERRIAERW